MKLWRSACVFRTMIRCEMSLKMVSGSLYLSIEPTFRSGNKLTTTTSFFHTFGWHSLKSQGIGLSHDSCWRYISADTGQQMIKKSVTSSLSPPCVSLLSPFIIAYKLFLTYLWMLGDDSQQTPIRREVYMQWGQISRERQHLELTLDTMQCPCLKFSNPLHPFLLALFPTKKVDKTDAHHKNYLGVEIPFESHYHDYHNFQLVLWAHPSERHSSCTLLFRSTET